MGDRTAFGPFLLDRQRRRLTRDGHNVPVGHRGYTLLETLLDAGGEPVSKEALMERVWPGTVIEEGSLTVQVSALRRQLGDDAQAMIITVPRVGYRLVALREEPRVGRDGPPLIAVLPFANHGSGMEDGYFADGVVDDIITALSRFKSFAVLSRGSTFALRALGDKAPAAAGELGARYLLEGSIRRMGDKLRVTAQLSEALSGMQLWAERYDGAAGDVFAFQDSITASVAGRIEPTIRHAEIERVRRKPTQSLDAYSLFLKAMPLVNAPGMEGHPEALALLQEAAQLDPDYALARAYAAWVYEKRFSLRAPPLGDNDVENCISLARLAMKLGSNDPLICAICGYLLYRVGDEPSGLHTLRQAVAENPFNVAILQLAGMSVGVIHGAVEEGLAYSTRAYELSPGAPEAYQFLQSMACMEFMRGNVETAIDLGLKVLSTFNEWMFTFILLTASYARLDRMDEAHEMLRRLLHLNPRLTIHRLESNLATDHAFATMAMPYLRKAGLPEQ
jgi:TolB-like protein